MLHIYHEHDYNNYVEETHTSGSLHDSLTFPIIMEFEDSRQATNTDPFVTYHTCIAWEAKKPAILLYFTQVYNKTL